ncbi:sigma-70 family RNA polymerase sigma factor [Actinoplanes sp. NBRC 103695]|uniref:sigma-70 family RNA polymerase sigma factor n=1 Tax=Actinoplanes sp. NBRC 103695 TaxID=3032202 RepID=UPI0024A3CE6A|nr:sigma-70 family RNA polymerase sigma factor [Actinoplanes sp. NBRC 103695]GLZ02251.1 RNA polymerase sigma factor [Actinoplanes sp. NBRC 103695]
MNTPEQAVPSGAEDGDEAALRYLQQVHRPVLLKFLIRLTDGDVHRAEDIVQETMLRAWRHPEARGADGRWSRSWLFTVARRVLIDQVRSASARVGEVRESVSEERVRAEEDEIERLIDAQEVREALSGLPDRLRIPLVAIYYEERSIAEVAVMLDVPAGTVRSRTFYALRALAEALRDSGFLERQPRRVTRPSSAAG